MTRVLLVLALLLTSLGVPGTVRAELRTFGLVVGTNLSSDPETPALRYADDDAVNNARLLTDLGAQVVLLAQLDADSRRLFPEVKEQPPTRQAVEQALTTLNQRMRAARAEGHSAVLYFFYSGHGDVENNRGYVNLSDGRFFREDLLSLLKRSEASENHVVIDACKSYFLVFERGSGGRRAPLSGSLLGKSASLPENTGVVLSTSSAAESHEWEAFQGGIFSHEIRSALRGAADLNLDRKVTYEEAAAFVWAANVGVPNPRYRPDVFVRPPGSQKSEDAVLADTRTSAADTLSVGPGVTEHLYLEDQLGRRIADLRPAKDQTFTLLLPRERPLFVHELESGQEVELPKGGPLVLASLVKHPVTVARRGAEHLAFRSLFARGFGQAALLDYRNCPPALVDDIERRRDLTWLRRGIGAFGIVSASVGATMTVLAVESGNDVKHQSSGRARAHLNERIDRYNIAAVTSYALAGAALSSYLLWTFWPERKVDVNIMPSAQPSASLSTRF